MRKYASYMLVGLNVLLAMGLVWLWVAPNGQLRNIAWQAPEAHTTDYGASIPELPGVANADTSRFIAMLDRPLFSPTRRPPPPPPPPQADKAPEDNLSTAQLSGIFLGANDGGIIVQIAGKHRRLRLREQLEGWTLTSVQDRSVVFSKDGQTRALQLPRAALKNYSGQSLPPNTVPSPAAPVPSAMRENERVGDGSAPPSAGASARSDSAVIRPSFGGGSRK